MGRIRLAGKLGTRVAALACALTISAGMLAGAPAAQASHDYAAVPVSFTGWATTDPYASGGSIYLWHWDGARWHAYTLPSSVAVWTAPWTTSWVWVWTSGRWYAADRADVTRSQAAPAPQGGRRWT